MTLFDLIAWGFATDRGRRNRNKSVFTLLIDSDDAVQSIALVRMHKADRIGVLRTVTDNRLRWRPAKVLRGHTEGPKDLTIQNRLSWPVFIEINADRQPRPRSLRRRNQHIDLKFLLRKVKEAPYCGQRILFIRFVGLIEVGTKQNLTGNPVGAIEYRLIVHHRGTLKVSLELMMDGQCSQVVVQIVDV